MATTDGSKEPSRPTVKRLFAVSGNRCAFPKCSTPLVDPGSGSIVGQVCHIRGEKPTAARYDPGQSNDERHGFDNLILLCNVHHKVADDDEVAYTADRLTRMKVDHEARHAAPPPVDDATAEQFVTVAIAALYLKTGDQGNYRSVVEAGYGRFLRRDFLAVLDQGERAGVTNCIFADYHRHLRGIEAAVQSFHTTPPAGWVGPQWRGFFMALQDRLGEGDWKYVPNAAGGFMGFWWHHRGDRYLQLEDGKLCFKIAVPDESVQTARWREWHHALMAMNGAGGVTIRKTVRRVGRWMTVAALDGDYRQTRPDGLLDFDGTMARLWAVESFMDTAADTQQGVAPASP